MPTGGTPASAPGAEPGPADASGSGSDPHASGSASQAGPLALGAVDEPPRVVRADAPAYPDRAERHREEATVHLNAVIDSEGRVTAVEVRCDGCDPLFLEATRTAVQAWRFVPARLRGRTVAVRFQQDIEFTLPDR